MYLSIIRNGVVDAEPRSAGDDERSIRSDHDDGDDNDDDTEYVLYGITKKGSNSSTGGCY
jgi:hypothetical protein